MLRKCADSQITEYKNHNLTIRLSADTLEDIKKDPLIVLSDVLSWADCSFIGETYCLNNWETGHTIYNCYSDRVYIFPWRYLDDIMDGKTIRLYARKPDETENEILKGEELA